MQPAIIAAAPDGKAIRQFYVADQSGVEISALQQIVGEHPIFRKAPFHTDVKGLHIQYPFPGKGAPVKEVVIDITGNASIRVQAALARHNSGKGGFSCVGQADSGPGLQNAIACGDNLLFQINFGLIHGVKHGSDHLPCRIHVEGSVTVQG